MNGTSVVELTGDGETQGSYGGWSVECPAGSAICAVRTNVEPDQGGLVDDTTLNDATFECCYY